MIDNIDGWLGVYQKELRKRGEMGNTLIAYCSDHGEMLGDRNMTGKSQPYHPSACVPLVLAGPGVRKNVACDKPVETLDLTSTFLDYAGLTPPKSMDSVSLRPFLEKGSDLPRQYARSSLKGWALVFDGRYKLIVGGWNKGETKEDDAGKELVLYDLKKDPAERNDIAENNPEIVERLKPLLPPLSPFKREKERTAKKKA